MQLFAFLLFFAYDKIRYAREYEIDNLLQDMLEKEYSRLCAQVADYRNIFGTEG